MKLYSRSKETEVQSSKEVSHLNLFNNVLICEISVLKNILLGFFDVSVEVPCVFYFSLSTC